MPSKTFEDLIVWQKAHRWVLQVYSSTEHFPRNEEFGLKAQLRRAAISVPANIAEGFRKSGKGDKARFYNIAQGSADECHYYLILAKDLGYCNTTALRQSLEEVSRLLQSYTRALIHS
ncbi:MAG: four helix bundle protein [Chloroflexi bacterium]|nr:four helix bundle protein [Chloroflexota bacterium]